MSTRRRGGPLEGVRVVEVTKVWAGAHAGKLLAYLGAEVVKIESNGSLDVVRLYGGVDPDHAPGFQAVNPEKLSAQINTKTPEGLDLMRELIARSDIFIHNLRPGAMERMGLGYSDVQAVNPRLVYVAMSMYGSDGPLASQTGYAPCFAAAGGLNELVGRADARPAGMNIRYGDSTYGAAAAFAAVVALVHAQATGEGQQIDVSAAETMTTMFGDLATWYSQREGSYPTRDGNRHADMAPHGCYACAEGHWVSIAVPDDRAWTALCGVMGRQDLIAEGQFGGCRERLEHAVELDKIIGDWTKEHDASSLADELRKAGVPAHKSLATLDVVTDDQLWSQEFFRTLTARDGEAKLSLGPSWRFGKDNAAVTSAAPLLGQDNDYVFTHLLGMSEERVRALIDQRVID